MIPFTNTPESWNELIASLPHAHLFQTWEMSQDRARTGWQPIPFIWQDGMGKPVAAAMVLKKAIPVRGLVKRICALYIPRGPLMDWDDAALRLRVLEDLQAFAKHQGAIYIKIDPDVALGTGVPGTEDAVEYPRRAGHLLRPATARVAIFEGADRATQHYFDRSDFL